MPNEYDGKHLKLWTPATYRIKVEGHLDESWTDRLGGMRNTMSRSCSNWISWPPVVTSHQRSIKKSGRQFWTICDEVAEVTED